MKMKMLKKKKFYFLIMEIMKMIKKIFQGKKLIKIINVYIYNFPQLKTK